jgi:hypothetical protein
MSEHILKDGRTLVLRDPALEDAQELLDFLKVVGAETDFLLCDENGIDGLTLEGEREWITATLEAANTKMFVGTVGGEIDFAKGTNALRTLSLEVREGNERAIALYKRFGFAEAGRHKGRINVRGTYYDEILMDLPLADDEN